MSVTSRTAQRLCLTARDNDVVGDVTTASEVTSLTGDGVAVLTMS